MRGDPSSENLFSLGLAARGEGRSDLAAGSFAQAVEAEPGNAEYYGHRAAAEFVLGRFARNRWHAWSIARKGRSGRSSRAGPRAWRFSMKRHCWSLARPST